MGSGPASHEPLIYYQGDTIQIDVTCLDGDGNALSLEGSTVDWKLDDEAGDNILSYSLGDGILLAQTPVEGVIEITVPADFTADLPVGWYQDQLRVTTALGIVSTQLIGLIEIRKALGHTNVLHAELYAAYAPEFGAPELMEV